MNSQKNLKLAMLGMVDGNGHPYSWSAIFNGYDPEIMKDCPYPGIPDYLNLQPKDIMCIPNANVTHIWTDDPADACHVGKASLIPNVVDKPEDVIGHVDAVVIATDKGWEHVERCRPFVEAGIPIFIDKPMCDNVEDLKIFSDWVAQGVPILSSSSMRYTKEYIPYRISTYELGELRYASVTMAKTWERYGIHALETIYPIIGPGFVSVRNAGDVDRNIVHLTHERGVDVNLITIKDLFGAFGLVQLAGTKSSVQLKSQDTYYSFKAQMEEFVKFIRTGVRPYPFSETQELMKIIIAGIKSREEDGREIFLADI